jgi:hypothetical protein
MADVAATADKFWSGCSISFSAKIAVAIAALASASGAAALIADFDPIAWVSESAPKDITTASFDARFFPGSAPNVLSTNLPLPVVQSFVFRTQNKISGSQSIGGTPINLAILIAEKTRSREITRYLWVHSNEER